MNTLTQILSTLLNTVALGMVVVVLGLQLDPIKQEAIHHGC